MTIGADRLSPMEERLKERIDGEGLLSYEAFLETVLYDERHGYYRAGKQDRQDYLTAPEMHALFGQTLGRYLEDLCDRMGKSSATVLELGGSSGRLAADIRSALTHLSLDAYYVLERGEGRAADGVRWVNSLDGPAPLGPLPSGGFTFVLANEFFDALPFHRVINRQGGLAEIYVGREHGFFEMEGPLSPPLAAFLDLYPMFLLENQVSEVTRAALPLVEAVSRLVGEACFLVFDYGYHKADRAAGRFFQGSMVGYRAMTMRDDLFTDLGKTDITHHVDFDLLTTLLEKEGWRKEGEIAQYRFLANAGIFEGLGALSQEERMAAKWIVNPEGLGSMISVLGFSRSLPVPLAGFRGTQAAPRR